MIPKRLISSLRFNALSTIKVEDSTIIVFNPKTIGLDTILTDFGVARIMGHEGWAYPASDLISAQRLAQAMADESNGYSGRTYKHNEGMGFTSASA